MSKKQFFWGATFLVILSGLWASCTKTGATYTTSPVTYVSVMNMAPYGPTTDIYLNSQLATGTGGIAPGTYSSKYGALQPGNYTIQFKKNGSDSLLSQIVPDKSLLDTLHFYTLIMYNDVNRAIKSTLIEDDFSSISNGYVNYRFFNLSPDAPNVDFYLNSGTTATSTGRTPADNVTNTAYNNFQSAPSTTFNLQVKVAGSDSVLATLSNQSLIGGNVYTIFLGGTTNNWKINVLQASY
jgi:hypothetical protein